VGGLFLFGEAETTSICVVGVVSSLRWLLTMMGICITDSVLPVSWLTLDDARRIVASIVQIRGHVSASSVVGLDRWTATVSGSYWYSSGGTRAAIVVRG